MDSVALGFAKEAGLKQLAGRAIKGIGRAVGSEDMVSRGMKMQNGAGSKVKTKATYGRKMPPPKKKVHLQVPHDTPKEQADLMRGKSKVKQMYVRPHGAQRAG